MSGPPASPKLTAPTKGSVMLVTSTPAATGMAAATIWPASLTAGGRSKRSSSAPTSAMTTAPARIPFNRSDVGPPKSRNRAELTSTPPSIASPPSSGVDPRAEARARVGRSTAPTRRASRAVSGVSSAATTKAARKA